MSAQGAALALHPWLTIVAVCPASETELFIHDFATGSVRLQIEYSEGSRANLIMRIAMDDSGPILMLGYTNGDVTMFSWSANKAGIVTFRFICTS